MSLKNNWNPRSRQALENPVETYDAMRAQCPVAHSDHLGYSVFRHQDVTDILLNHTTYSSRVSRHVSVPNSMDPPEHTAYREIIDRYFTPSIMASFEPVCRDISETLIDALAKKSSVEIMEDLAHPWALQMQCAFLGWPTEIQAWIKDWVTRKNEAALAADTQQNARIAQEFEDEIQDLLNQIRQQPTQDIQNNLTARLLQETVDGQPISDKAVISILRNWTVGELQTIAACIGIIFYFLANRQDIQTALRTGAMDIDAAVDEMLRIEAPLLAGKRTPAETVTLGGYEMNPGDRITLSWQAANRDPEVFPQPDEFKIDRDPSLNLLYGLGIHVCPGAPLSRLELRTFVQVLLERTQAIEVCSEIGSQRATYPQGGYERLGIQIQFK